MEMGDNELDSTTPLQAFTDSLSTSEEWIHMCNEGLKPTIRMVFDTLEEG
ncbi:Zinc finger, SWIM-type [Sesbania bispinosa]|nr:Zinc finger, SWIM-type [Sesbania bispinosa]